MFRKYPQHNFLHTSLEMDVTLYCPSCGEQKFILSPMMGKNAERFVRISCQKCSEFLFFQTSESPEYIKKPKDIPADWKNVQITNLQQEWEEWIIFKEKHLYKPAVCKFPILKNTQILLALLLCTITIFFVLDRWHLLDPLLENPTARQKHIMEYTNRLLEVPCFPSIMKENIKTIPIRYTREQPINRTSIMFGETGVYWGEEQIKIHRSNFWFFGLPKNAQLLNTLVHELRHRSSPSLGHNSEFFELVSRDTKCVHKYWSKIK